MRYAVIKNGIVVNIIILDSINDYTESECIVLETNSANIGDEYRDGNFIPLNTETIENIRSIMIENLAEQLVLAENKGITFNGNQFATDKDSQVKYLGILMSAMIDPTFNVNFKTMTFSYVSLNASEIQALCMSVKTYIQQCFDKDDYYTQLIMSATTIEELNAIDLTQGWP